MRRKIPLLLLAILSATLNILSAGCDEDETDELTVDEIIERGKAYLGDGDGLGASQAFEAALVRDPENVEAKYGIILGNTMQLAALINELMDLLEGFDLGGDMAPLTDGGNTTQVEGSDFSNELQIFVDEVIMSNLRQADVMYIELEPLPEATFSIDSYVLYIGSDEPLIAWSGELDKGELCFLGAVNSLLLGVFDLVLAHNIDIDINNLNLPEFPTGDESGDDDDSESDELLDENTIETIDLLLEWLNGMLTDPAHPDLLYLDSDGVGRMQASGRELGSGVLRLRALIDYTQSEAEAGRSDGPVYWDDTKGLVLGSETLALEPALVESLKPLLLSLNESLFDGTPFDVDPGAPNPLDIAAANELLIYLGLFEEPLLPAGLITIDIGTWFQDPAPDGLRSLIFGLIDIWDLVKQLLDMF